MPKSKRDKVVHLTQTAKKGRGQKTELIDTVRDCVDAYRHLFVFSVSNERNASLKQLREQWKGSRFFLGKNKVVMVALGRDEASEHRDGLAAVSDRLHGNCGLLFTNVAPEEVMDFFGKYEEPNFARSGFKATERFVLPAGPIAHPVSMEPMLRKLGLPTRVADGTVVLARETVVCREGEVLSPEQAKTIELFGVKMAKMRFAFHMHWSDGKATALDGDGDGDDDGDE